MRNDEPGASTEPEAGEAAGAATDAGDSSGEAEGDDGPTRRGESGDEAEPLAAEEEGARFSGVRADTLEARIRSRRVGGRADTGDDKAAAAAPVGEVAPPAAAEAGDAMGEASAGGVRTLDRARRTGGEPREPGDAGEAGPAAAAAAAAATAALTLAAR